MATTQPERIATLDIVRGVAVMGILFMNIVGFAMPEPAYMNPRAYGGASGIDLAAYIANFILFDGKMRGLFSFLFGASMLLVIERAEMGGQSAARVHYSRMIWLLVFGLLHLWLIWWGDILTLYALVGMTAYYFRDFPTRKLVRTGIILLGLQWLLMITMPIGIHSTLAGLNDAETAGQARRALEQFQHGFGVPSTDWIGEQLALMRGGYGPILADRLTHNIATPLNAFVFVGAETLAYMLFGMAALKSGMLTGAWPRKRYAKWTIVGFAIGIPAYAAIAAYLVSTGFALLPVAVGLMVLTLPFRPPMILAWAALIILAARPGGALTTRIAAAGRMAFSNYLGTSIVCTTFFYGYGFGQFGRLSRAELYLVVIAVCAAMLLWSKPWLARFRYGPLEWLWRSAARGKLQPISGGATTER
ncbi:DUF418 domain-containing protein [Stakelama marina]|uniref:DUF418 domain-containing protein n=1 Tax=Stakelama marina TaxID=2826939 RepID=A0A8T4ICP7_9SPHN|nr:DUF418 domain-containing protein [Stakelama marina]MBR0552171.1 DUF418 domain-containing protein [Stakelama marina]